MLRLHSVLRFEPVTAIGFFGVKGVAKGVVGGTATAFLTYPLFVGVGFALHNVLELAIGERNWREILRAKQPN